MQSKSKNQKGIRYTSLVLAEPEENQETLYTRLWHLATAVLLAVGVAGILGCFVPGQAAIWLYPAAALYMAGLILTDAGQSAARTALFVLPLTVAVLLTPAGFGAGFLHFVNQCVAVVNQRFGLYLIPLTVQGDTLRSVLQWDVVLLAGVLWLVYGAIRAKSVRYATFFCLAAFLVIGLAGLSVSPLLCGILSLGWVMNWVEKTTGYGAIRKSILYMIPLLLCLAAVVLLVGGNLADANAHMAKLQDDAAETLDTLRYGSDTLPQGSMTEAAAMGRREGDALQVSFAQAPQELYLRGFTGGNFAQSAWLSPDGGLYHGENEGIIRWMQENDLTVPLQLGTYYAVKGADAADVRNRLEIRNVDAYSRYLYLPYQSLALTEGKGKLVNDTPLQAPGWFGSKSYGVDMRGPGSFQQSIVQLKPGSTENDDEAFDRAEQVYRIFVHENYLTVSDEDRTAIETDLLGDGDWTGAGLSQVTTRLRIMLQSVLQYAAVPTVYDGETDFVPWLLAGDVRGNSAYYATAAVLAYRCAGIPARYVEGYYFGDAAARQLRESGEETATLSHADAHAWAEVYLDGMGWVPVETTPGFYYAEYSVSQVLGQPDSAVNIVDDQTQNLLQGSTADALPTEEPAPPTPETPLTRSLHLLGIALLAAILLWLAYLALELQAAARRKLYDRRMEKAAREKALRCLFREVFRLLHAGGFSARETRPYDAVGLFGTQISEIAPEEYITLVKLLGKTVYGECPPDAGEMISAKRFVERLQEAIYEKTHGLHRLAFRYGYGYTGR